MLYVAAVALALMGTHAYVGGAFTQTADNNVTNLNSVARLSSGSWVALPDYGLNNRVFAMAVSGSDLYAGGGFTASADGAVTDLNYIARYSLDSAPSIATQPANRTACPGASVSFAAAASGFPTPTVQWQSSSNGGATFTNIAGATSTTLTFTA